MRARGLALLALALAVGPVALLGGVAPARAQEASAAGSQAGSQEPGALARYYQALAERRLVAAESGSDAELEARLRVAEELYLGSQWEQAAQVLYELVESPRFSDFQSLERYRGAEYLLAGALSHLGALRTAFDVLLRILRRGPEDSYFAPAYRRAVDVALEGADLPAAVQALEALGTEGLAPDAQNELRYLRARAAYEAGELEVADGLFAELGRRSRFYANARYLRGAIAARRGALEQAEEHFCSIASTPDTDRYTFYVDQRYFDLRDLTWLALGRVAHEGRRAEDAFYYYFQVPNDSARVAEALFEASWSMYEGNDHDTALDLIDQLEARFPRSPYVDEASILRGYIHLARCDFVRADIEFRRFQARFTPLLAEIDRVLANPARQARLFEDLLAAERRAEEAEAQRAEEAENSERDQGDSDRGENSSENSEAGDSEAGAEPAPIDAWETMVALLRVEPSYYRLHREIRTLDAEAARAGRVSERLGAILARLDGADAPRAADAQVGVEGVDEATALRRDLESAEGILEALGEQLDQMRARGAEAERLRPLEERLAGLGRRVRELRQRLRVAEREHAEGLAAQEASAQREAEGQASGGADVAALLRRDRARARRFTARATELRARMVGAANEMAVRSLRQLKHRLSGYLRRSRIGRIDAVMGSRRRIEIQIQSLAAGRFPPELQDPLRLQGLLRDDEEYWPFEGELWPDEFEQDEEDLDEEDEDDLDEGGGDAEEAEGEEAAAGDGAGEEASE